MRSLHLAIAWVILPFAAAIGQPVWTVDSAPILVGRTRIPIALAVHEIGRDYILGTYADAVDEVHLAVLRLRRQ